jgi:hypothetical protein
MSGLTPFEILLDLSVKGMVSFQGFQGFSLEDLGTYG